MILDDVCQVAPAGSNPGGNRDLGRYLEIDERGEVVWHPVFLDFARYWGFQPRLCRSYRAQTKGKGNRV